MTPPLDAKFFMLVATHYIGNLDNVESSINISYGFIRRSNFIINTINDGISKPGFTYLMLSYFDALPVV